MFTEFRAVLKYVRISPQKVRQVIKIVKGEPVGKGLDKLKLMPQKAAKILVKVISSALANAENHGSVDVDSLHIYNITADQGSTLKRFKARARGRGSRILKRTTHIKVTLI